MYCTYVVGESLMKACLGIVLSVVKACCNEAKNRLGFRNLVYAGTC